MKALGKSPDEVSNHTYVLGNEDGKSPEEVAEEIANYFADISANFEPINRNNFHLTPPLSPFTSSVPCFPLEYEIYNLMKKSKKTSGFPGDVPIKILCEYLP